MEGLPRELYRGLIDEMQGGVGVDGSVEHSAAEKKKCGAKDAHRGRNRRPPAELEAAPLRCCKQRVHARDLRGGGMRERGTEGRRGGKAITASRDDTEESNGTGERPVPSFPPVPRLPIPRALRSLSRPASGGPCPT